MFEVARLGYDVQQEWYIKCIFDAFNIASNWKYIFSLPWSSQDQ